MAHEANKVLHLKSYVFLFQVNFEITFMIDIFKIDVTEREKRKRAKRRRDDCPAVFIEINIYLRVLIVFQTTSSKPACC